MVHCYYDALRLWDLESSTCLRTFKGHRSDVSCVAVPAVQLDGHARVAISGSFDMQLRLWNLDDGRCVKVFKGHKGVVWDCEFLVYAWGSNILT